MVKYFSPTFFLAFLGVVSIELNDPKKLVLDLDEYVDEDVSFSNDLLLVKKPYFLILLVMTHVL